MKPAQNRTRTLTALMIGLSSLLSLMLLLGNLPQRNTQQPEAAAKQSNPSSPATATPKQLDEATQAHVGESFGKLPLSFEMNQGQVDEEVKFLSRGPGYSLFLTPTEAVLSLSKPAPEEKTEPRAGKAATTAQRTMDTVVRMSLVGANAQPQVTGADELPGKINYFRGNDPSGWRTDVPAYERVRYEAVYPGVDLVYYGNQQQLQYDFHLAPGARAEQIRLDFTGAKRIEIARTGELILHTAGGAVRQHKPYTYQEADGEKREVASRFVLHDRDTIGFEVADYDPTRPLVIDPVLVYSTFFGGEKADGATAIAVDAAGNAYITGFTTSTDFPTLANDPSYTDENLYTGSDIFVVKLNAAGSNHLYSTFIGGFNTDSVADAALYANGNLYLAGGTDSVNFPTTSGAFQSQDPDVQRNGSGEVTANKTDGFVLKLNAAGNALLYSTYLGGRLGDRVSGIALDQNGFAYVAGSTHSSDDPDTNSYEGFPVQSPLFMHSCDRGETCSGLSADNSDAFVTKLNQTGTGLVYSTFLGGKNAADPLYNVFDYGFDAGADIAVDAAGNAYVVGNTTAPDFPTHNPLQPQLNGDATQPYNDAFLTKINAAGTALVYSTFLGGNNDDTVRAIAVNASGDAYLTGNTESANYPVTSGAFQSNFGGQDPNTGEPEDGDAFITKVNSAGTSISYSTYYGGSGDDVGHGIALPPSQQGNSDPDAVHVISDTNSPNLDLLNPLQSDRRGASDAFIISLDGSHTPTFATLLGGNSEDEGNAIAADALGDLYVAGLTYPVGGFPLQSPYQSADGGTYSTAFITKIRIVPRYFIEGRVLDNLKTVQIKVL